MPRLVWDQFIPVLRGHLLERRMVWHTWAQENVEGMQGIPRNSWKHLMARLVKKERTLVIESGMFRCSPKNKHKKMVHFIEGTDVEMLLRKEVILDWASDPRRCLDVMIAHFKKQGREEMTLGDLADMCSVCGYPMIEKGASRTEQKEVWDERKRIYELLERGNGYGPARRLRERVAWHRQGNEDIRLVKMEVNE